MPVKTIKNSLNNHRYLYFSIFIGVALLSYFFFAPSQVKLYLNSSLIGKWLTPSRNALKKVANIIHLPYWFEKSNLPTYYITISQDNVEKLLAGLPFDSSTLSYDYLLDDGKQYVKADFKSPADNYESKIKIRYRGWSSNNWDAEQKALRIKFPKDDLFSGMSALNFFLPYDRSYFGEMLNSYRAKKFGLLPADFKFVSVFINGRNAGVYLASEPWSKEFLARNGVMDTDNIFSNKDMSPSFGESLFLKNHLADWKSYTAKNDTGTFEELDALTTLINDADDDEFARKIGGMFDLEKLYRWQLLSVLAHSSHESDTGNSVLLFRKETGKFELLPWDVELYPPQDSYAYLSILTKRVLSNKKFLSEYQKVVSDYTSNEENLKDDLAYYDDLDKKYHFEFYKDQAKLDTDYIFDRKIGQYRSFVIGNFRNAERLTSNLSVSDFVLGQTNYKRDPLIFKGSFKYFNDIFLSPDQFIANHYQFRKSDDNTIILPTGTHIFDGITIVPQGFKFVIEPGAQLLFAPEASLISYSPVIAVGTADNPIVIRPLREGQAAWGSFGVINTESIKNQFSDIRVSGGAGSIINGVVFTSQFSLHNTVSEIADSVFGDNHSDDSLHAINGSVTITNSKFINNNSDGVDFDYVKNAALVGNFFFNQNPEGSNGDGIDLSGTRNVEIKDNKIMNFGDKCISVGEYSQVFIKSNVLANCAIGIAIKDNSRSHIEGNSILANRQTGIALYRKKQEFIKGGWAEVLNSILWGNKQQIEKDMFSSLVIKDSVVESGYAEGEQIKTERPDFSRILPAYLLEYLYHE